MTLKSSVCNKFVSKLMKLKTSGVAHGRAPFLFSSFHRVGNAPRSYGREKRGPLGTQLNEDQDPLRHYPLRVPFG